LKAEALLQEMHALYRGGNRNVKPNTITYNSIIQALCNDDDSSTAGKQADKYLQEMKDMNIKPDKYTYSSAIKAWKMSKHPMARDRILELKGEMATN
jgi:hypothetical protein